MVLSVSQTGMPRLPVAVFAVLALCCAVPPQYRFVPSIPGDTLPPWRYGDMVQAVLEAADAWNMPDIKTLELLAWYGKVDDRPRYVNVALFWAEMASSHSTRKWALFQIGQNPIPWGDDKPKNREVGSEWGIYTIFDVDWRPIAVFDHPPTNLDAREFLRYWDKSTSGWKYLTSGVRTETWKRLLGEAPTFVVNHGDAG